MATRRKRPVLYEIVRHTRRTSDVGWRENQARGKFEAAPAAAPAVSAPVITAPEPARVPPPVRPVSEPTALSQSIRFTDGKLLMELAWPGMTVAAVAIVAVLAVAFQAGARYARPSSPPAAPSVQPATILPEETRPAPSGMPSHRPTERQPIATPVKPPEKPVTPVTVPPRAEPAPLPIAPPAPPPPAQPSYEFKKGYHYVVVQHFKPEHKDTAEEAASFLKANGIDCVVNPRKSDIELVATEAFLLNQKDGPAKAGARKACDALKLKIRTLGATFAKQQATAKKPQYPLDQPYERLQ